jgi:hypothetical protein
MTSLVDYFTPMLLASPLSDRDGRWSRGNNT